MIYISNIKKKIEKVVCMLINKNFIKSVNLCLFKLNMNYFNDCYFGLVLLFTIIINSVLNIINIIKVIKFTFTLFILIIIIII